MFLSKPPPRLRGRRNKNASDSTVTMFTTLTIPDLQAIERDFGVTIARQGMFIECHQMFTQRHRTVTINSLGDSAKALG